MGEFEISQKIKLGFSGGGFRATFYCIGAYRRLVELGIHNIVSDISSVSGGSIAAAAIMMGLSESPFNTVEDFDKYVTNPVINLAQSDLRNKVMKEASFLIYFVPMITCLSAPSGAFLLNWIRSKTSNAFPQILDKTLFKGKLMKDLPLTPEWSCNATCLNTLKRFRFKQTNMYGNKLGVSTDVDNIKVSFAVAASAAYPLGFAPLKLKVNDKTFKNEYPDQESITIPEILYLTDGGVYDNLGSESLLKDKTPFIMLDASAETTLTNIQPSSIELWKRTLSTSLDQIVALRRRLLFQKCEGVQLLLNRPIAKLVEQEIRCRGVILPSYEWVDPEIEKLIASIRTDLDSFHDIEIELLMWSGAIRMDMAIQSLFPNSDLSSEINHPEMPKYPIQQIKEILEKGSERKIFGKLHRNTCANKMA